VGSIIRASCTCGFTAEFFGGSEKHNYSHVCYAPALCRSCGGFHVLNYMDADCRCPTCKQAMYFYNDASLSAAQSEATSEEAITKPGIFILPLSACLCPQCGKMNMHFEPVSCCE
jgi:hypothetical protein